MTNRSLNAACYLTIGLLGIYISVYQSVINILSVQYEINSASLGIIIALHFIGSLTAPAVFGEISDRIGKKPVIVISLGMLITGLLAVFFFNHLLLVAAGIFLIGCGFAVVEGTLSGVLSEMNALQSTRVISISQMFFSIGAMIGPLTSLWLIKMTGSWKTLFFVMILLFGILMVYFTRIKLAGALTKADEFKTTERNPMISMTLLRDKVFILLLVSMFVYVGIEEGIAFWVNTYFTDIFDSNKLGTYTLSGYWAGMILGRYLAAKFYARRSLFFKSGLFMTLLLLISALLLKSSIISVICFIGAGFGISVIWPVLMSIAAERYPRHNGTAMGIMMTAGAGGGAAVPFLAGVIANFTNIGTAFWIFPAMIVLILLLQASYNKGSKNIIPAIKNEGAVIDEI